MTLPTIPIPQAKLFPGLLHPVVLRQAQLRAVHAVGKGSKSSAGEQQLGPVVTLVGSVQWEFQEPIDLRIAMLNFSVVSMPKSIVNLPFKIILSMAISGTDLLEVTTIYFWPIHVASRRQPPAPHRCSHTFATARNCQWYRPLRPKASESTDCRKKKREEFDSHV